MGSERSPPDFFTLPKTSVGVKSKRLHFPWTGDTADVADEEEFDDIVFVVDGDEAEVDFKDTGVRKERAPVLKRTIQ